MAKRFTSTELWSEDWFLVMPSQYKLFWYYMLSKCDHAGLFKVNLRTFCSLNEVELTSKMVLEYFNADKQRIRIISESVWMIEDFFVFQYGHSMNINNKVHKSIIEAYNKYKIELGSIRGVADLTLTLKDKDKDTNNTLLNQSLNSESQNQKNGKQFINVHAQREEIATAGVLGKSALLHRRKENNTNQT